MNSVIKTVFIVTIIAIVGVGVFLFLTKEKAQPAGDAPIIEEPVLTAEEEFNQSGRAKAIEEPTDLWQYYESEAAGFSLQYPHSVAKDSGQESPLRLAVSVEPVAGLELNAPMRFDRETALANIESLAAGEYGEPVDWPLKASQKVKNIGQANAQEFMVLGRFEVCSVTMERKLYFFHNDQQIVIALYGPTVEIMAAAPEYFELDAANCGEHKKWAFDQQAAFYAELARGEGTEQAQEWFDTFDDIVNSIEFFNTPESLLLGRWHSLDDPESAIEFTSTQKIDYYADTLMSKGVFTIEENSHTLTVTDGASQEIFTYMIVSVDEQSLVLRFLPRGNTLRYTR